MNNQVNSRLIINGDSDNKEESILSIISRNKSIPKDIKEEAIKQFLSYNLVRLIAAGCNSCIDVYKISDDFFKNIDVMKYLESPSEDIHKIFCNIILSEVGKIVAILESDAQVKITNFDNNTIILEINDMVSKCAKSLKNN